MSTNKKLMDRREWTTSFFENFGSLSEKEAKSIKKVISMSKKATLRNTPISSL